MGLTLAYNLRHVRARRVTNLMTIIGIALVVFVYVATLMLAAGLRKTLSSTGSPQNVIVIRQGSQNEIQSGLSHEQANIILNQPEVLRGADGSLIASRDVLVLISLKTRNGNEPSNVNLRGVSGAGYQVRDGVTLSAGRLPTPGTQEVIVGRAIHERFQGTNIGESLRLVGTLWPIVGTFDAGNSAFSSEIWGDANVLMPAFHRIQFSSVTVRLAPGANLNAFSQRLEDDRRLNVAAKSERDFYADQSNMLALFIEIVGQFVSVVFSLGAIIGAMITMYSAVAGRTREIAILRALGFSRTAILGAFLRECVILSLIGGALGIGVASLTTTLTIATTNFQNFSVIAFGFSLTPGILAQGLLFALIMGVIGGILPAIRAARLPLLSALRA